MQLYGTGEHCDNGENMKRDFDDLALLLGALLGFALSSMLILSPFFIRDIDKYQTLLTGLIAAVAAVGGAAATVWVVNRQIRQAQDAENERRTRQLYAARAMMPHALTALSDYAEQSCGSWRARVREGLPAENDTIVIPPNFRLPDLPTESMAPLQRRLEFGEAELQSAVALLIQCLQVQQSRTRIRHIETGVTFGYQYLSRLAEALEIYARAAILFHYSRGTTEDAPAEPTKADMMSAVANCGFWHERWNPLRTHIDTRWKPYKPIPYQQVAAS
jgi:hypothetical protein